MTQVPGHLATQAFVPENLSFNHMGWGPAGSTEQETRRIEGVGLERAMAANPQKFEEKPETYLDPTTAATWAEFQKSKGYEEGSCDLSIVEEFYFGRRFHWLPQDSGSCTLSNSFRNFFRRTLWEVLLKGELETLLGSTEYGPTSVAFYAPLSYGIARQLAGIRNGDGGICSSTIQSMMMGVLRCDNPKLNELLKSLNANKEKDFPEPRDVNVYRKFQNWTYNDLLKPFLTDPLEESLKVVDIAGLDKASELYKPSICCSMLAIKKGGVHNTWAHNMSWCGKIKWFGRLFYLLSNESWQDDLIYPIPAEEVDEVIFPRYRPEIQTLGKINMSDASISS